MYGSVGRVEGKKTKFFIDVKRPIRAGMPFGSNDYKIKTIGHTVYRLYYDSKEKDMQVGVQIMKRIIK
jgi:hypothetical protein